MASAAPAGQHGTVSGLEVRVLPLSGGAGGQAAAGAADGALGRTCPGASGLSCRWNAALQDFLRRATARPISGPEAYCSASLADCASSATTAPASATAATAMRPDGAPRECDASSKHAATPADAAASRYRTTAARGVMSWALTASTVCPAWRSASSLRGASTTRSGRCLPPTPAIPSCHDSTASRGWRLPG